MKKFIIFLLFMTLATPSYANVQVGTMAPDFESESATGEKVSLSDFKGKYIVLEWSNYECPFVRKHYDEGNMQSLQKQYTEKGVVWLTIMSSAPGKQGYYEAEEMLELSEKEKSSSTHILLDPSGDIARLYKATNTPHMYVVDPEGKLIYMGAIDSIRSGNTDDIPKAENYVVAALDAALAGNPIAKPVTSPYGCTIKFSDTVGFNK